MQMMEEKMSNIILRPLEMIDSDFMLELVNDPEVTKYLDDLRYVWYWKPFDEEPSLKD